MEAQLSFLFDMVKYGNLQKVQETIAAMRGRFDIKVRDRRGRTILHWACYSCHHQLFDWILSNYKVDFTLTDDQGYSVLELAILNGPKNLDSQTYMVKKLIAAGAIAANYSNHAEGPLHWAFYFSNSRLIDVILENNFSLFFQLNAYDLYPIDYLMLELKPPRFKVKQAEIFKSVVWRFRIILESKYRGRRNFIRRSFKVSKSKQEPKLEPEPQANHIRQLYIRNKNALNMVGQQRRTFEAGSNETDHTKRSVYNSDLDDVDMAEIIAMALKLKQNPNNKEKALRSFTSYRIYPDKQLYHKKPYLKFQLRLLFWCAHFDDTEMAQYFMERKLSPFEPCYQGYSPFHRAAQSGSVNVLQQFLFSQYYTRNIPQDNGHQQNSGGLRRKKTLNKNDLIDQLSKHHPSTALHLAIESEQYECAKFLVESESSTNIVNYRNMPPFRLTKNQQILNIYYEYIHKERRENFYERGYIYVLQTNGKRKLDDDIVYHQLLNIKDNFSENNMKFEFVVLYGHTTETLKQFQQQGNPTPEYFYYVIRVDSDTIYRLASKFNFMLYHLQSKLILQFHYQDQNQFEYPKDLDIQQMIMMTLNEEFDVDKFILEGLLVQHFPIQDQEKFQQMIGFWHEELHNCIVDTMAIETEQRALRPLHSMSQYYGPVIGWYFAFLVQLVAWLILPSIFAFVIIIYCIVTAQLNSLLFPVYGFTMVIWGTFFIESWKRRENELSYCWDMHYFKKREQTRVMYQGQYHISKFSSQPEVFDKFTTFYRRLLMDGPIIMIGIASVVACFLAMQKLTDQESASTYVKILFGCASGIIMNVLSAIYKILVNRVVQWENHRFDSEFQFSYIMKLFIFEFINSYITLIYQIVVQVDPNQLAISVASITITRGIIQNFKSNIVPYLLHHMRIQGRTSDFKKISDFFTQNIESEVSQQNLPLQFSPKQYHSREPPLITGIHPINFNDIAAKGDDSSLNLSNQSHTSDYLLMAEQLELLSQLSQRAYMQDQKHLIDEYTDLAIQFGYITMFATSFPPGPIFFMLNCYFNLRISLYNYTNVMKREVFFPISASIWLSIFNIMSYSATIMNCIIIWISYSDKFAMIAGAGSEIRTVSILVAIEHIVLFVKYVIAEVIDDVPKWVQRELKRCKIAEREHKYA